MYDKMEKEVTDLTHDIERLQRQEQIDAMLKQPTSTPITTKPGAAKDAQPEATGTASKAYVAFWDSIRNQKWYDVKNVFIEHVVGAYPNGGYLVPDEYEKPLVNTLSEENFFRTIAHVIQTDSGAHTIPVVASHGTAA